VRVNHISVTNHSRIGDLDVVVGRHLVIVGANDVGKSSLLRLLNLLLGSTVGQLYNVLSLKDLRDPAAAMRVEATFADFDDAERRLFHREIDVAPSDSSESLRVRLEVVVDADDPESVTVTRWCPGRGDVRALTREQLGSIGWRFLPATRAAAASSLDGPTGAVRVLLETVESDLGGEKAALGKSLLEFNDHLAASHAIGDLRQHVAEHLSKAMPKLVKKDDLAVRTATDPEESVLDTVSLFTVAEDGTLAPMSEQSDGVRQLTSITLYDLAEKAAKVIAVDEPELHLHPSSQRTLARLLTDSTTQKIIVTHSPYVVHRFDPSQVVAISPDGVCRQLDAGARQARAQVRAHWWSPRILEALTCRIAVLVEGVADRVIVEAAAEAHGLSLDRLGVTVFELGGAENFRTVYRLLGPGGFGARILGLVDQKESASWVGEVGGKPTDVLGTSIFVCDIDLEEEYCKSLGPPEVIRRLLSADLGFREDGILSAVKVATVEQVTIEGLAEFCRRSNRKVIAALAVAGDTTAADRGKLGAVSELIDRLADMSR